MARDDETRTAAVDQLPTSSEVGEEPVLPGPHLEPGATLGRYVVLYRVGGGGMGVIYAAYDGQLDRKVAIKLLRSDLDTPARRDLLRREAKAMARLRHPNVVRIYDVGEDEPGIFIAMEFVDGPTLRDWLATCRRSWREILRVFLAAGRGLEAAHRADLVHQDFKPSNVMLGPAGQPLVTDFGLARMRTPEGAPRAGVPGELGTPAYLAPERGRGHGVDVQSDQFSFCAALYQALYGHLPFEGSDSAGYAAEAELGHIRLPRAGHGVPGGVLRILRRGLQAEPEQRYPSMGAVLRELSAVLRSSARRRVFLSVASVTIVAALAAFFVLGPWPEPCSGASGRIEPIWNAAVRERMRATLLAADPPISPAAWSSVEQGLDRYVDRWQEMYAEACEATHVRHEQSERILDLRMWCLDDRLVELDALVGVMAAGGAETVSHAASAVSSLRSVAPCGDRPALDRIRLPPLDERAAAQIDRAREVVETQFAVMRTGGQVDIAVVTESLETATLLAHASLEARAAQLLSHSTFLQEGELAEARQLLHRALRAAIRGGDQPLVVILYAQVGELVGIEQGRPQDSWTWFDLGEATLDSLGPGYGEQAQILHHAAGIVAHQAGQIDEAFSRLRRSFELAEKIWLPDNPRRASIMADFAMVAADRGDGEMAVSLLERATALRERAFGPSNPDLGHTLATLSGLQAHLGRYPVALETVARARRIVAAARGEGHLLVAYPDLLQSQILVAADRPAEAEEPLDRALPVFRDGFGEGHPFTVSAWLARAERALLELRLEDAEADLGTASQFEFPADHPVAQERDLLLGRLRVAQGEWRAAASLLDRRRESIDSASDAQRAWIHNSLGTLALQRGHRDEAAAEFQRSLSIDLPHSPQLPAEARFGLARAQASPTSDEAVTLAWQALREIEGGSPRTSALRRSIERWLRENTEPAGRPASADVDVE